MAHLDALHALADVSDDPAPLEARRGRVVARVGTPGTAP